MRKVALFWLMAAFLAGSLIMADRQTARAQAIELKLAHFMPPVHVQHTKNFIPFAEKVAKLSNGQVTVKIYPGGTLGDARQLYDATLNGVTDIAFFIPSYLTGRFPRCSAFELPALFDSAAHLTRASYEVYDKYIADDFKDVKVLCMYGPGQGQLGFVNKNVRSWAQPPWECPSLNWPSPCRRGSLTVFSRLTAPSWTSRSTILSSM